MPRLFTKAFWVETGWALARTAGAALVPILGLIFATPDQGVTLVLANVIPVVILAIASSLGGLPPTDSGPWYTVAFQRAVRQFGQYFLGTLPATFLLTDIGWDGLLRAAAASALATFIMAALSIIPPPAAPPLEAIVAVNNNTYLPAPGENEGTAGYSDEEDFGPSETGRAEPEQL